MIKDKIILTEFLKSGLSTRQIDSVLGYKNSRGWKSWEILKKYNLNSNNKGSLFVYSDRQANSIILRLMSKKADPKEILKNEYPECLNKYKNIKIKAHSEKCLYQSVSGETRNLIRNFFSSRKKSAGRCQFKGCRYKGELDTVHLAEDRPSIFISCAKKFKKKGHQRYLNMIFMR